jgi:uncharacterized protein
MRPSVQSVYTTLTGSSTAVRHALLLGVAIGSLYGLAALTDTPIHFAPLSAFHAPKQEIEDPLVPVKSASVSGLETLRLSHAPSPDLVEDTPLGLLPKIGDGRKTAWQTYARPFKGSASYPKISLVMADMGLSRVTTDAALTQLPGIVTFIFSPYAGGLENWIDRSRDAGHEVLIDLPAEPAAYPQNDPGPETLLIQKDAAANLSRLHWVMSRGTGYVGLTSLSGAALSTAPEALEPVLQDLKTRGLLWLDSGIAPYSQAPSLAEKLKLPFSKIDLAVDSDQSPAAIDKALSELVELARIHGQAVGLVRPYPVTIDRLKVWLKTVEERGILLAPLSATVAAPTSASLLEDTPPPVPFEVPVVP